MYFQLFYEIFLSYNDIIRFGKMVKYFFEKKNSAWGYVRVLSIRIESSAFLRYHQRPYQWFFRELYQKYNKSYINYVNKFFWTPWI